MTSHPSTPDAPATNLALSPNRKGTAMSLNVDPATGRPAGAAEPHFRYERDNDIGPSSHEYRPIVNSTDSLLPHENHAADPCGTGTAIPLSASPTPISGPQPTTIQQDLHQNSNSSRHTVFLYLIRKTSSWVLMGVFIMLLGIGLLQAILLPRIYTCPVSATCPGSFDPNKGNVLQLLQSFISYWLKASLMISSIGILKLSAYQTWFILMHQENTIKNLDLHLGAIRGSVNDAVLLLFRKNNRLLSVFIFALYGISAAISLITGLSIDRDTTTKVVTFQYNGTSDLPNSSLEGMNNDGQLKATQKVIPWALDDDKAHDGALRGTLVVPDARTSQAVNAVPGGPTIDGSFTCEGWNNYTKAANGEQGWYIWFDEARYIALPEFSLAASLVKVGTALSRYVWVSNTTGLIPNATQTDDGGMNIAHCHHYVSMKPEEPRKPGVNYLNPTDPKFSGCHRTKGTDPNVCVADSVNNAILNWWGGQGRSFWGMSCRGGVLGPVPNKTDQEKYCPITQELWKETTIAMLDGIMQTSPNSGPTKQNLQATVESLSKLRWWVNATIPGATLVIYMIGLLYTCWLSQGVRTLKELNLEEVMQAAQTDHIHDLLLMGQLRRAPIRYDPRYGGFVGSHLATTRETEVDQ